MQILQPLTVGDVRLASGHILYVTRVDQVNSEPLPFQDLKQGNPVHPRRFHRYGLGVASSRRGRSSLQVCSEDREMSSRLLITIWGHGDVDLRCSYIHTGGIRIKAMQHWRTCLLAALSFSRHGSLPGVDLPCESAQTVQN